MKMEAIGNRGAVRSSSFLEKEKYGRGSGGGMLCYREKYSFSDLCDNKFARNQPPMLANKRIIYAAE